MYRYTIIRALNFSLSEIPEFKMMLGLRKKCNDYHLHICRAQKDNTSIAIPYIRENLEKLKPNGSFTVSIITVTNKPVMTSNRGGVVFNAKIATCENLASHPSEVTLYISTISKQSTLRQSRSTYQ